MAEAAHPRAAVVSQRSSGPPKYVMLSCAIFAYVTAKTRQGLSLQETHRHLGSALIVFVEIVIDPRQSDHGIIHIEKNLSGAFCFEARFINLRGCVGHGGRIEEILVNACFSNPGDQPEPGPEQNAAQEDIGITFPAFARLCRRGSVTGRRGRTRAILPRCRYS